MSSAEEKLKELQALEKRKELVQARADELLAKAASQIILNVGGTEFYTSKHSLNSHRGSALEVSLSSGKWMVDAQGRFFIDRDPDLFLIILNYLRTGKINLKHEPSVITKLKEELAYYMIDIPELTIDTALKVTDNAPKPTTNNTTTPSSDTAPKPTDAPKPKVEPPKPTYTMNDSKLVTNEQRQKIYGWLGKSNLQLLFRASTDGYTSTAFHEHCDNKGPTLVLIVSTTGYIFGGYAPISWNSDGGYTKAPGAFTFSLSNPSKAAPAKYDVKPNADALYFHSTCGPAFSIAIFIQDNGNTNECKSDDTDYLIPNGTFLTGSNKFLLQDYEVYTVK